MKKELMAAALVFASLLIVGSASAIPVERPDHEFKYNNLMMTITPSSETVKPEEVVDFSISLSVDAPDTVTTDGTYERQWAGWAIVGSDSSVYKEGSMKMISGSYSNDISVSAPSQAGDYALVAVVIEQSYEYSGGSWALVDESVMKKESQKFTVKPEVPEIEPTPGWSSIVDGIVDWISGLFG